MGLRALWGGGLSIDLGKNEQWTENFKLLI
jgi:hypothetical protein